MPVTPTYPGVYVQEVPSGVRTIVGVGTSTALFIGPAKSGPLFRPVRCLSYTDFTRKYSEDPSGGQLPYYVRLFFLNGGTDCWIMRIANGAASSSVTLRQEAATAAAAVPVLRLTAKSPGLEGEQVRAVVSFAGQQPESTFRLDLFRSVVEGGVRVRRDAESWPNLSMDVNAPTFAPTFLTQNSKLVDAAEAPGAPAAVAGYSEAARPIAHNNSNSAFKTAWTALVGLGAPNASSFLISVDGSPYVDVDLGALDVAAIPTASILAANGLRKSIKDAIEARFATLGILGKTVAVTFPNGPTPTVGGTVTTLLRITSGGSGDVYVRPAPLNDMAVPLMLGTEQGGLEVSGTAARRPAPNGLSFRATDSASLNAFRQLTQNEVNTIVLETLASPAPPQSPLPLVAMPVALEANLQTATAGDPMYIDAIGGATSASPNGHSDGVREKLGVIATAINGRRNTDPNFPWVAEAAGSRLTLRPDGVADDNFSSAAFRTYTVPPPPPQPTAAAPPPPPGTDIAPQFETNVKCYTLGKDGLSLGYQVSGTMGSDGTAPLASDYTSAYAIVDKQIDLFNLLVLTPDASGMPPPPSIYSEASVFCRRRRAFLVMDPPTAWTGVQAATDLSQGVNALRVGLEKQHSAIFFPRVTIEDRGRRHHVGPAGAIAGVMARIDGTRGVWKAPAGTEADLRGVVGVEHMFSDPENGVLNPKGINTIRVFPNGIVSWGARTMDGDDSFASEYKYIPIRRLALFLEESLYRGLTWVTFEPNDEPLWAQIRLNVGAFMHDLFRKGAFQGATPRDAFFVKCDGHTTTQTDRNLGIVNVMVGFAPLKPAEFVVLYLQQMAGQIEV